MSTTAVFVLSLLLGAVCATSQDAADSGPDGSRALRSAPDEDQSQRFIVPRCLWFNTTSNVPANTPEFIDTTLQLYTRKNAKKGWAIEWKEGDDLNLNGTDFDGNRQNIFVAHGLKGHGGDTWLIELKDGLLHKVDANVFGVDWHKGAKYRKLHPSDYDRAASNTRVVGNVLAKFARQLISRHGASPARMYGVGFSLGGQVMAFFGKGLPGLARITGLDPAAPCFEGQDPRDRLAASDAVLVDIVHTTFRRRMLAGSSTTLGFKDPGGHVDFFLDSTNFEGEQPGCEGIAIPYNNRFWFDTGSCSHAYAPKVFTASLLLNNHALACHKGYSRDDGQLEGRNNNKECVPFGYDVVNSQARGSFNLNSTAKYPYLVTESNSE